MTLAGDIIAELKRLGLKAEPAKIAALLVVAAIARRLPSGSRRRSVDHSMIKR